MTAKYQEPELLDPRTLESGDQLACLDSGNGPTLATSGPIGEHYEPIWFNLCNTPGETTAVWGRAVPKGQVAIDLAGVGWTVMILPKTWARRQIR